MIIDKIGLLKPAKIQSGTKPYMIILHDTAGPTLGSAESTFLHERIGLGYHFMIDRLGQCFQYAKPDVAMNHALGFNQGTIGISFVGGGGFGAVNEVQIHSVIDLIVHHIVNDYSSITMITGHKHCSPGRKVDPQFLGEPNDNVDLKIDAEMMHQIAYLTGLDFDPKPV